MGPSVRGERVGDLGANAGVGVLMRREVGTARARAIHGAVYSGLEVGEGTRLFSNAASTWKARPCELVCLVVVAFETVVPDLNPRSY